VAIVGPAPDYARLGGVPLEARFDRPTAAALAPLRDMVVAAGTEGGLPWAQVVDPFLPGPRAPRRVLVAAPDSAITVLGVAGSSKFGVAGLCWGASGARDIRDFIDFRLVGEDGVPRGRAVRIVEDFFRGGIVNCSVGTDELGFLVAWWDGDALWVRRVHLPR